MLIPSNIWASPRERLTSAIAPAAKSTNHAGESHSGHCLPIPTSVAVVAAKLQNGKLRVVTADTLGCDFRHSLLGISPTMLRLN